MSQWVIAKWKPKGTPRLSENRRLAQLRSRDLEEKADGHVTVTLQSTFADGSPPMEPSTNHDIACGAHRIVRVTDGRGRRETQNAAVRPTSFTSSKNPSLILSHHRPAQQISRATRPRSGRLPPRRPMPCLSLRLARYALSLQFPRSPESPRRIAGTRPRAKPARHLDTTKI